MDAKIKEVTTPEDFGLRGDDAQKARYYAEFLVAAERERCAKVAEAEDVAPTDDPIGVQQCIAASIRNG